MKARILSALAIVLALAFPVSAQDQRPPLGQVESLNSVLLAVGIADEIRNKCDSISGRVLKGIGILWSVVGEARDLGYSDDEINAYRTSDQAKAALRVKGEAYLAEHGVSYDDPESFCRLGREEIATETLIGSLLRAK